MKDPGDKLGRWRSVLTFAKDQGLNPRDFMDMDSIEAYILADTVKGRFDHLVQSLDGVILGGAPFPEEYTRELIRSLISLADNLQNSLGPKEDES